MWVGKRCGGVVRLPWVWSAFARTSIADKLARLHTERRKRSAVQDTFPATSCTVNVHGVCPPPVAYRRHCAGEVSAEIASTKCSAPVLRPLYSATHARTRVRNAFEGCHI